ncbi:MAG: nuclear transport factor 2 family protein [Pseudomonadota bacterium]
MDCASVEAARRAQIAARINRLQDETDVQNLQHAFGYYLDRKLYDDAADLFAASGEMKFGNVAAAHGAKAIKASLIKQFGPSPLQRGELFDHILMSTVITIAADGRHAQARTSQLGELGKMGDYANWELGEFDNSFVKEGGTWKVQAVHYQPTMITDFDLGWSRDWRPKPGLPMALRFPLPHDEALPNAGLQAKPAMRRTRRIWRP